MIYIENKEGVQKVYIPTSTDNTEYVSFFPNESDMNLTNYYTKVETVQVIDNKLKNYYPKSTIDGYVRDYTNEIDDIEEDLTNIDRRLSIIENNGGGSSDVNLEDYYTKNQADNKFATKISVNELNERVNNLEENGGGDVNLDNYYTKEEIDSTFGSNFVSINDNINALNNRVTDIENGDINLENYYTKEESIALADERTEYLEEKINESKEIETVTVNDLNEVTKEKWNEIANTSNKIYVIEVVDTVMPIKKKKYRVLFTKSDISFKYVYLGAFDENAMYLVTVNNLTVGISKIELGGGTTDGLPFTQNYLNMIYANESMNFIQDYEINALDERVTDLENNSAISNDIEIMTILDCELTQEQVNYICENYSTKNILFKGQYQDEDTFDWLDLIRCKIYGKEDDGNWVATIGFADGVYRYIFNAEKVFNEHDELVWQVSKEVEDIYEQTVKDVLVNDLTTLDGKFREIEVLLDYGNVVNILNGMQSICVLTTRTDIVYSNIIKYIFAIGSDGNNLVKYVWKKQNDNVTFSSEIIGGGSIDGSNDIVYFDFDIEDGEFSKNDNFNFKTVAQALKENKIVYVNGSLVTSYYIDDDLNGYISIVNGNHIGKYDASFTDFLQDTISVISQYFVIPNEDDINYINDELYNLNERVTELEENGGGGGTTDGSSDVVKYDYGLESETHDNYITFQSIAQNLLNGKVVYIKCKYDYDDDYSVAVQYNLTQNENGIYIGRIKFLTPTIFMSYECNGEGQCYPSDEWSIDTREIQNNINENTKPYDIEVYDDLRKIQSDKFRDYVYQQHKQLKIIFITDDKRENITNCVFKGEDVYETTDEGWFSYTVGYATCIDNNGNLYKWEFNKENCGSGEINGEWIENYKEIVPSIKTLSNNSGGSTDTKEILTFEIYNDTVLSYSHENNGEWWYNTFFENNFEGSFVFKLNSDETSITFTTKSNHFSTLTDDYSGTRYINIHLDTNAPYSRLDKEVTIKINSDYSINNVFYTDTNIQLQIDTLLSKIQSLEEEVNNLKNQ